LFLGAKSDGSPFAAQAGGGPMTERSAIPVLSGRFE
jgi:hypothetical protein